MNPYPYVWEATKNGESLLSLCAGIGLELGNLNTQDVTAVDIHQKYLDEIHTRCPQAKLVQSDVADYIEEQPDDSVDVISFIDGLEHLDKENGRRVLEHCKRVARQKVLVFTQDGYLRNEPHDAWGITGGDEYQKHKSGWSVLEVKDMGYDVVGIWDAISQHGEPYKAVMYVLNRDASGREPSGAVQED